MARGGHAGGRRRRSRNRIATIHRPPGTSRTYTGSDALGLGDVLPGFAPTVGDLLA